jgi:hypothetical protein
MELKYDAIRGGVRCGCNICRTAAAPQGKTYVMWYKTDTGWISEYGEKE